MLMAIESSAGRQYAEIRDLMDGDAEPHTSTQDANNGVRRRGVGWCSGGEDTVAMKFERSFSGEKDTSICKATSARASKVLSSNWSSALPVVLLLGECSKASAICEASSLVIMPEAA